MAGIDEAGRGALAGPVAAGVVIFPTQADLSAVLFGVRDSKQMSPQKRSEWVEHIKSVALDWGVGFATNAEIDKNGIIAATHLAIQRALAKLHITPQHLLVDFLDLDHISLPQTALVKGDCRSLSIAAASVIAKTSRDALMIEYDHHYPGYGFAEHKGYATPFHLDRIQQLGASPLHRLSFAPLNQQKNYFESSD
ncbi:MAG: ribonuclease HII [Anaerolineales bacterium]